MSLYVERDTRLLYEVQLFEDFAIVRKAGSGDTEMNRLTLSEFPLRFEEYGGIEEQVYDQIIQAEKK